MSDLSREEIRQYYESRVPGLKDGGPREYRAPCPVHAGKDLNFAIDKETGLSFCHSACQRGFDVFSLEMQLFGLDFPKAKAEVYRAIGRPAPSSWDRDVEAEYLYQAEDGTTLYRVVRKTGKKFLQQRPGPVPGRWIMGRGKTTSVPYHLPRLLKADKDLVIGIGEGEKAAESLERAGWVGTTNDGGAEHFKPELVPYFKDRHVAIFPDNDEPGRKHALQVAKLLHGHAASIKIVEIPGLKLKGDVTDFVNAGGTGKELHDLYTEAQEWTPEWDFPEELPHENDKYLRSFGQYVVEAGGPEAFWEPSKVEGLPTPFEPLTEILGGLRKGEIYLLGGDTGSGKTSIVLQFMMKCMDSRKPVLYFSMEMGHRDVFQRTAAIDAQVDLMLYRRLKKKCWDRDALDTIEKRLFASTAKFSKSPILVSTKSSITPEYLMEETLRVGKRAKIEMVVIDHMQLMGTTGKEKHNEYERFSHISRVTKQVASELEIPVLLVSQTTRAASREKRTELEMWDMRGSGALEEDAGTIMMLYPDLGDLKEAKSDGGDRLKKGPVKSWLKIAKNRYGSIGAILLLHMKSETRFELDTGE